MTLFLLQPFSSHYYPVFQLARNHRENGEKVVFPITSHLVDVVSKEGFDFCEFQYLTEYMIKNMRSFLGFFLKNLVSNEFYEIRETEFENAYTATKIMIEKYRPTKVYIDQCMADYYFFLKPHVSDITILHTRFYSGKTLGIPPMNSKYIPNNTWFSRLICEGEWYRQLTKQYFKELLLKIAFLGKDETYLWRQYCKKHGLNWSWQSDFKHFLNRGVKNVDNIVLAPETLEFKNFNTRNDVRFFGELSKKNESLYFSEKYRQVKKELIGKRHIKVIYLAFGSLSFGQKKVQMFFNQVISLVAETDNVAVIISKGGAQMQLLKSNNSLVFDFVPQLDILTFADLFITHGGLGSVKEAYHAKVPMLVVPLNKKIDQPGNAARVKAAGLGDMLDIDSYSKKELSKKINCLLSIKSQTIKKHEEEIVD